MSLDHSFAAHGFHLFSVIVTLPHFPVLPRHEEVWHSAGLPRVSPRFPHHTPHTPGLSTLSGMPGKKCGIPANGAVPSEFNAAN